MASTKCDGVESRSIQAPVVDVIVPVYRGLTETRRCLESVLAFPQQTSHEIVIIDDCSPEPDLSAWLHGLVNSVDSITLLVNLVNSGFVNAVNRGMVLHPDRDVVLLNSDTEVHGDWLDRLRRCAYSDSLVGTATPFSNNATICSYPCFCQDNLFFPAEGKLAELDGFFAGINAARYVEIPTAVGFCMYITRRCIEQVGYFDAQRFGRGYGEENDFCLRASELGFKHLLCADTFVYHRGAVSFGIESESLMQRAMEQLRAIYPAYDQQIASHVVADPARQLRRRIDFVRLRCSGKPRLLFINHCLGGGTDKHVQELAYLLEPQFEILILKPHEGTKVILEWAKTDEELRLYFSIPTNFDDLIRLLQEIGVVRVHFHHLIGHHPLIASLPQKLRVPYDYTLHDYFPICPQFNLTTSDGRYCGEPETTGCNRCLEERSPQWRLDITAWRSYFLNLLAGAERVIGPSQDVINRISKYIPDANFVYLSHPELKTAKVLVLGMMSPHKGGRQLEACAKDAKKRHLPLSFRILGFRTYEKLPVGVLGGAEPDLPILFSGPYADKDLSTLIAFEQADVIYFPAQWPETYSYTLSAALNSGLPILAPKFGAFVERLKDYSKAYLIEWDDPAEVVNNQLLDILANNLPGTTEKTTLLLGSLASQIYLEQYSKAINQNMAVSALHQTNLNELIRAEYVFPELTDSIIDNLGRDRLVEIIKNLVQPPADQPLTWLAVEAWRNALLAKQNTLAEQLADKEKLLADKEQALAWLEQILAKQRQSNEKVRQYNEELQRQLEDRKEAIREIYSSTSWWLSRPVRWLGRQYRQLRGTRLPEKFD